MDLEKHRKVSKWIYHETQKAHKDEVSFWWSNGQRETEKHDLKKINN